MQGNIETTGGTLYNEEYKKIIDTIKEVFSCKEEEIANIQALQKGLTNIVLKFDYNGGTYVYRHPGLGSDILVDRGRESIVQKQIEEADVDKTLVVMNVEEGWRISKFIENRPFDYHNLNDVVRAILLLRNLHSIVPKVQWNFDIMKMSKRLEGLIPAEYYGNKIEDFVEFDEIKKRIEQLYLLSKTDGIKKCLTHGDCRDENFLVNDDEIYLIDWEYAGFGDPGFDIGTYICGGTHSQDDIDKILFIYFGRKPSNKEKRHYYAYIALSGYFYMHWTMYKESCGQKIEYLKSNWYEYAKVYSKLALELYKEN